MPRRVGHAPFYLARPGGAGDGLGAGPPSRCGCDIRPKREARAARARSARPGTAGRHTRRLARTLGPSAATAACSIDRPSPTMSRTKSAPACMAEPLPRGRSLSAAIIALGPGGAPGVPVRELCRNPEPPMDAAARQRRRGRSRGLALAPVDLFPPVHRVDRIDHSLHAVDPVAKRAVNVALAFRRISAAVRGAASSLWESLRGIVGLPSDAGARWVPAPSAQIAQWSRSLPPTEFQSAIRLRPLSEIRTWSDRPPSTGESQRRSPTELDRRPASKPFDDRITGKWLGEFGYSGRGKHSLRIESGRLRKTKVVLAISIT